MTFYERLRALRESKNITQAELAKHLQISTPSVQNYECGRRYPPHDTLLKMADFFGVSTDYIFGREESQPLHKAEVNTQELATNLASVAIDVLLANQIEVPANKIPKITMDIYKRIECVSADYLLGRSDEHD